MKKKLENHHLLWWKSRWESPWTLQSLRREAVIALHPRFHRLLHQEMPQGIHPPTLDQAQEVLKYFWATGKWDIDLEKLGAGFYRVGAKKTAHDLRHQQKLLALYLG